MAGNRPSIRDSIFGAARRLFGGEQQSPADALIGSGRIDAFIGGLGRTEARHVAERVLSILDRTPEPALAIRSLGIEHSFVHNAVRHLITDPKAIQAMSADRFDALNQLARNLRDPGGEAADLIEWSKTLRPAQIRFAASGLNDTLAGVNIHMNRCAAILGGYQRLTDGNPSFDSWVFRNITSQPARTVSIGIELLSDMMRHGSSRAEAIQSYVQVVAMDTTRRANIKLRTELNGEGPYGLTAQKFVQSALLSEGARLADLKAGKPSPLLTDLHEYLSPQRLQELGHHMRLQDPHGLIRAKDVWRLAEDDPFIAAGRQVTPLNPCSDIIGVDPVEDPFRHRPETDRHEFAGPG